jgi:nitroimidazol reductase NimA-like FMN-containing flavoprotein (pyridoxamine 5'-phosphate oxidase superfamily)
LAVVLVESHAMSTAIDEGRARGVLAGVHVGVLSLAQPWRAPLTVPIWYRYTPGGELAFMTGRDSRKGWLLAVGTRVALCAQTEQAPYKYVSLEGVVTAIDAVDVDRDTRPMAHRLPRAAGRRSARARPGRRDGHERPRPRPPELWSSVDYAKQFGG